MSRSRLIDEPWRAVCPNGHNSWHRSGDGYRCQHCGYFPELCDAAEIERAPNPMRR